MCTLLVVIILMDDYIFFFCLFICLFVSRFVQMQHTKLGAEICVLLIVFVGMVRNENKSIFPFLSASCVSAIIQMHCCNYNFGKLISFSYYLGRDGRDGRNGKKNEQQTSSSNVQVLREIKGYVASCFKIPSQIRE